ncbi:MAG TPA: cupredoxin family copper-binding protein [Methylocystis sp.]|nr:cupredoxin family copper-binding protein [Methylocystis sp.]
MRYKICLALALARVAFNGARAFAAQDATVAIDNFAFTPATLTVKAGTKVVFVNHDDIPHNVVGEKLKFRSRALDTDESFAFVFDKPGDFVYFCGLHPQMKGEIRVTP